jgi:hypothetical protein
MLNSVLLPPVSATPVIVRGEVADVLLSVTIIGALVVPST